MAGVLNQFFTMMELRFGVVIIHPDQEMSGLAQVEDTRPVLLFYIKQDQIAEQHVITLSRHLSRRDNCQHVMKQA